MIKVEQLKGTLTGLLLGEGRGFLGHLLYVDDCLLVARASVAKAGVVLMY